MAVPADAPPRRAREVAISVLSLALAAAIWLPAVHWFFQPDAADELGPGLSERSAGLAARFQDIWADPAERAREVERMRSMNAEWDLMGRTFLVASLANIALRDPSLRGPALETVDRIIDDTLARERESGPLFFLLGYANDSRWVMDPPRSQFLDGEMALMLGLRRLVEERGDYRVLLQERVATIVDRMERGPVLCAESYPNECWAFCNSIALAAIAIADSLDGTDHAAFLARWVRTARERLTDPQTGLLVSSYTLDGRTLDGPEGTSIWMAAHFLQLVDPSFAEEQFRRAKDGLARSILGFGYSREWPPASPGRRDIDSGAVIPLLEASTGASGLALVGARAFGDDDLYCSLLASLKFGGFPIGRDGRLSYGASNGVGDAVILYASVLGPAWDEVRRRAAP